MWTKWCTRICDKFLFMLDPEDGINNSSMIREMDGIQKNTPKHLLVDRQLIIFHQNKNTFPTNTIKVPGLEKNWDTALAIPRPASSIRISGLSPPSMS